MEGTAGPSLELCAANLLSLDTPHLTADAEEDERRLPRRKAATTIDTATAEEDVKDFHVPEKQSDRV